MLVAGAGTGGTITGIARKLKEKCPNIKVELRSVLHSSPVLHTRTLSYILSFFHSIINFSALIPTFLSFCSCFILFWVFGSIIVLDSLILSSCVC